MPSKIFFSALWGAHAPLGYSYDVGKDYAVHAYTEVIGNLTSCLRSADSFV